MESLRPSTWSVNGSAEAPSLGNARGRQTPSRPRRFRPIGELNGNFHGNTTMSHDFFRGFPWFSRVFRCVPIFMGHFHGEHDDEPGWILGCSYNFQTKPCHFMIGVYIHHIAYLALAGPRTERRDAGLGNSKYSCYVKLYVTAFEWALSTSLIVLDCIPILTTLDTAVQSLQFRMYVALFLELELVNKTTSNCLLLLHMVTNHFSKITRCAGFPWFFPNSFGSPSWTRCVAEAAPLPVAKELTSSPTGAGAQLELRSRDFQHHSGHSGCNMKSQGQV